MKYRAKTWHVIGFVWCVITLTIGVNAQEVAQKSIVIFIPSYNNALWYKQNLDSVFAQQYQNYRVIYIDDCSTDNTGNLVEQYIKERGQQQRVTLIKNTKRKLAMANIYTAVHLCDDDALMVSLDGDDWFAHDNVLNVINNAYQDPYVWLTYGNYTEWPDNADPQFTTPVPQDIIKHNNFRHFKGNTAQPRTFYAWLFKQIKLKDLFFEGTFVPMSCDIAYPVPMFEMAGSNFKCIMDVLYVHNMLTQLNDHKVNSLLQGKIEDTIRTQAKYQPLATPAIDWLAQFDGAQADMVIFSENRALQLYALLESIQEHVAGLATIHVIYRARWGEHAQAYENIKKHFTHVQFVEQNKQYTLKSLVQQCTFDSPSNYILFAQDTNLVIDAINITACIKMLEKTHTHTFDLLAGNNVSSGHIGLQRPPDAQHIEDDVYAWQFAYGAHTWQKGASIKMALYRKADIKDCFEQLHYSFATMLEKQWANTCDLRDVGLFYDQAKAIRLFLCNQDNTTQKKSPVSPQELVKTFNAGLKLDRTSFCRSSHRSTYVNHIPKFIE